MSEETTTTTGSQPQSDTSSSYSNFLGTTPEMDLAEESPETSASETTEEATETESESVEEQPEVEQETESETQEEAELPRWLEDLELSPEELAHFKKRYPSAFKSEVDEDVRYMLRDRVKDHREIQERRARELQEEPTQEEEQAEVPTAPTPEAVQKQREAYYKEVDTLVDAITDPKAVEELGSNLLQGFGVDVTSKDPEIQALVKNAPKVGRTLARGAVDIMATALPQILMRVDAEGTPYLARLMDTVLPGTLGNYERSLHENAWEEIRTMAVTGKDGKVFQPYAKLPAYGKKDSEFGKMVSQAAQEIGLDRMVFRGTKQEQAKAKYALLAKFATGQKVTPETVQRAVETGKKQASAQAQKTAAARALGSGQPKASLDNTNEPDGLDAELEKFRGSQSIFGSRRKS